MTTPEEELYVLVADFNQEIGAFVFASMLGPLKEITSLQEKVERLVGKTRIAKLQFVEEE